MLANLSQTLSFCCAVLCSDFHLEGRVCVFISLGLAGTWNHTLEECSIAGHDPDLPIKIIDVRCTNQFVQHFQVHILYCHGNHVLDLYIGQLPLL